MARIDTKHHTKENEASWVHVSMAWSIGLGMPKRTRAGGHCLVHDFCTLDLCIFDIPEYDFF